MQKKNLMKRIISIILIISIFFLCGLTLVAAETNQLNKDVNNVYMDEAAASTDPPPSDNLTEQPTKEEPVNSEKPVKDKKVLDLNELFEDKIIGRILKDVEEYSDADDKEKNIILEYFQIQEELFIECEERAYSLIDSIFAASIAKNHDFSLDEVERMLELYVNIREVYRQINKFELFKEEKQLSDDMVKKVKDLILEGYLLNKVETAYSQSKLLEKDIEKIISNKEDMEVFDTLSTSIEAPEPIYHDAPFDFRKNRKEYIRASNGSLTYEEVDLSLPGRNGLDLNLVTRFQSVDAGSFNYFNYTTSKETGDDPLGIGWTFGFSNLFIDGTYKAIRLATGEIYGINKIHGSNPTRYEMDEYDLKDIEFKGDDGSFTNGVKASEYFLEYKNGKKEYFADDGRLLGIVDRYGNTIKFEHKYSGQFPVITKIIDTLGRTVEICYLNDCGPYAEKTIVTAPDGSTIEYLLNQISYDHTYGENKIYELEAKIDREGRRTEFSNSIGEADVTLGGDSSYNDVLNIKLITYPTGAQSHYLYEKTIAKLGRRSYNEYYRITFRYDSIYSSQYNVEDYDYVGDYSAYGVNDSHELDNYTYSTTITDGNNTQRTITFKKYDPDGRKIKEEIKENGTDLLRETNYEYDSDKLPIREEEISYNPANGTSITKVLEWDYDNDHYADLIEYTDELGHKTTYTYDSNFHRLESETRYLDPDIYEKTEYEIDSSSGNVNNIKQHYLDDGTWKMIITDYTYDSYGNRISEKTRMEDGSFVIKNYEYHPEYQHGYLTKVSTNVKGYDLNDLSKTSHTIEENFAYNFNTGNQLAYINGNSKLTSYQYDKLGRVTKITYHDTDKKIIDYNDEQNIVTVTDEEGYETKHIYDKLGRLLEKREEKDGAWITTLENHYNSLGQIDWTKDGEDNKTTYEYDALGRQTKIINPDSTEIKIAYDDAENSKTIENEEGDPHKYYYNKIGNLIGEVVMPDKDEPTAYITYYSYDYIGNLISKTDANGNQTKYDYDNLSRLISVRDPYDKMTKYQYTYLGDLKKITTGVPDSQEAGYQINKSRPSDTQQTIFSDMIATQSTSTTGHTMFAYADISYYGNNKFFGVISQEYSIPLGEERSGSTEVIKYDTDGSEFEVVSVRIYDSNEMLNWNPVPFKIHTYTEEEKAGGTVSYTQSLTEEHSDVTIIFCYQKKDTTEGSTVTREYDELGRPIKETDPLNKAVYMSYDRAGNIIGKRDRNGEIKAFSYDDRNRLLNQNVGTQTTSYTYYGTGNIKSMEDSMGTTSYTYYENGRLKRQTEPGGKYIQYDYDKSGNKIKTTDYFAKVIDYGYDNRNRLETVTVDGLTTTYGYYPDGARQIIMYPGGVGEAYVYDGINNLKTLAWGADGTIINEFNYTYDKVGNQLTKVDEEGTTVYTYDKLNRLKTVSEPDGNINTYTYDDNGNIAAKDMDHDPSYTYTFKEGGEIREMKEIINHTITFENDDNNRLIKVTENVDNTGAVSSPYIGNIAITTDLTYDDNGNLLQTTKGGSADEEISSYNYNELNQMTEYTSLGLATTTYGYSGTGLRKTKTSGSTTAGFYYEGQNVINETENGVFKARNIRGINLIAREDNAGTKAYYLYNGHGDVVNLVTDSGDILNTYDYDVYGKEKTAQEGTLKNPYRYAGEYYDEESEVYYLRGRYYDPNVARFISEDSYKGDVKFPLSLNLYTYTYNNPLKYVDPSGHIPEAWPDLSTGTDIRGVKLVMDGLRELGNGAKEVISSVGDKIGYFLNPVTAGIAAGVMVWDARTIEAGDPEGIVPNYSDIPEDMDNDTDMIPQKARDIAEQVKENNGRAPDGYIGGRVFNNDGRSDGEVLPEGVDYKEYDVNPYVRGQNRGAERIVIGNDGSEWYTDDHYKTFKRMK